MVLTFKGFARPAMGIRRIKSDESAVSTQSAASFSSFKKNGGKRGVFRTQSQSSVRNLHEEGGKQPVKRTTSRKVATEKTELVKSTLHRMCDARESQALREVFTEDATYTFPGNYVISVDELIPEHHRLVSAMPDFKLTPRLTEEVRVATDNGEESCCVVVHGLVAEGTHTGTSYGFGPYTPIEATGKHVKNDPEEIHYFFEGDKICRAVVRRSGKYSGPAGIYTQLGGLPIL